MWLLNKSAADRHHRLTLYSSRHKGTSFRIPARRPSLGRVSCGALVSTVVSNNPIESLDRIKVCCLLVDKLPVYHYAYTFRSDPVPVPAPVPVGRVWGCGSRGLWLGATSRAQRGNRTVGVD